MGSLFPKRRRGFKPGRGAVPIRAAGGVEATALTFPTKWFAKRLPGAFIANNLTFLLCVPLEDGRLEVVKYEIVR